MASRKRRPSKRPVWNLLAKRAKISYKKCSVCDIKRFRSTKRFGSRSEVCENCGQFFARSIVKQETFECVCENEAAAAAEDSWIKNCKKCHYAKCLEAGMQQTIPLSRVDNCMVCSKHDYMLKKKAMKICNECFQTINYAKRKRNLYCRNCTQNNCAYCIYQRFLKLTSKKEEKKVEEKEEEEQDDNDDRNSTTSQNTRLPSIQLLWESIKNDEDNKE